VPTSSGSSSAPEAATGPPGSDHRSDATVPRRLSQWFLFWPLLVYIGVRTTTLLGVVIVNRYTHKSLGTDLSAWDGKWFISAARHGWPDHLPTVNGHVTGNTSAFFPLYPLAIRWFGWLTSISPLTSGLVISGATGLTAVVGVGMLVRNYADEQQARRAALFFVVFPGTFVFSLAYSEGIAISCLSFGLLALLRKKWVLAGLLGLLATATSPIALAFVLSCAWCAGRELIRNRDWRSLAAPVLAPLGFLGFMLWLWAHTDVMSAWRITERQGWQSYPSVLYPVHIVTTFVSDPVAPTETGQILFVGTVVGLIGAVLAIRQRQPAPVLIYGLAAFVMAAVAAPVGLRPRFLMLAFPLVVAFGTYFRGRAFVWAVAVSAVLLAVVTAVELASTAVFP
jgi:Mannosyltransferase (PIG-V)